MAQEQTKAGKGERANLRTMTFLNILNLGFPRVRTCNCNGHYMATRGVFLPSMHNLLTDVMIGGRELQTYAHQFSEGKGLNDLIFLY